MLLNEETKQPTYIHPTYASKHTYKYDHPLYAYVYIYAIRIQIQICFFWGWYPRGVMVKAMDCGIVVREFVLQSRCYVHFRANTLG